MAMIAGTGAVWASLRRASAGAGRMVAVAGARARTQRAGWAGLLLGLLLGLSACGQPASQAALQKMKVGLSSWVGHDPLLLARDRGLTDARPIKRVELQSSAETMRHLRNGVLDAAALIDVAPLQRVLSERSAP